MLLSFTLIVVSSFGSLSYSNATAENIDKFGIQMIYPTNASPSAPKQWLLDEDWKKRSYEWEEDNNADISEKPINNSGFELNINSDGQIRFPVLSINDTSHLDNLELSQDVLERKGFMGTPQDWKNVEVTFYAKVNNASGNNNGGKHFEIETRGGPTHNNDENDGCEGVSLHANLYVNGRVKLEKELSHTKGYTENDPQISGVTTNLMDRWIGMKGIFYNTPDGNVQIELWLDKNANNDWGSGPVLAKLDNGEWYIDEEDRPNECRGNDEQKVTWGGPVTIFRWDNLQNIDFKWASIREIIPPQ